jgi:YHS domain-containing protein
MGLARLFVFAIIVWIAYFVVKTIWKAFLPSGPRNRDQHPGSEAELIRDPQCGAYFMRTKGVKGVVQGKVIHFCSEQCYDQYLKKVKGER